MPVPPFGELAEDTNWPGCEFEAQSLFRAASPCGHSYFILSAFVWVSLIHFGNGLT